MIFPHYCLYIIFLGHCLTLQLKLNWHLVYGPGWPHACGNLLVSAYYFLALKTGAIMSRFILLLQSNAKDVVIYNEYKLIPLSSTGWKVQD